MGSPLLDAFPFVELGSFGLLAYLVLRFAARVERALDTHTRVVAELVVLLAQQGIAPTQPTRAAGQVLAHARSQSRKDMDT